MTRTHKKTIVIIAICLALILLVRCLGLTHYFSLTSIKENAADLHERVQAHYVLAVLLYCSVYLLGVASTIPAVAPLSMVGGFLFGVVPSVIYATLSATIGALISFLLMRRIARPAVENQRMVRFKERVQKYGASYLLVLHFLVVVPFFVINMAAALAGVSLWTFIWTTIVGSMPVALIYSIAGRELATIESGWDLFSGKIIAVMAVLITLAIIPVIIKRLRGRRREL